MPKTPKTSHPNNMNFFNKSYVFTLLLLQMPNQRMFKLKSPKKHATPKKLFI